MFCKLLFLALYIKYIVIKDHFLEITWERYTVHNMLNELLITYFLVWFSHPNILYQGANHAALGWPIHLKRRHSAFYRCKIVSLTDSHTLNRRPLVWKCKHKKLIASLMNVVKSASMWIHDSSPSVMQSVASAHTPPYLWSRRTLMTSLFACRLGY